MHGRRSGPITTLDAFDDRSITVAKTIVNIITATTITFPCATTKPDCKRDRCGPRGLWQSTITAATCKMTRWINKQHNSRALNDRTIASTPSINPKPTLKTSAIIAIMCGDGLRRRPTVHWKHDYLSNHVVFIARHQNRIRRVIGQWWLWWCDGWCGRDAWEVRWGVIAQ
jgi:hypothetical protein